MFARGVADFYGNVQGTIDRTSDGVSNVHVHALVDGRVLEVRPVQHVVDVDFRSDDGVFQEEEHYGVERHRGENWQNLRV